MKEKLLFRKMGHPQNSQQGQGWEPTQVNDTLNIFDNSESRTPTLILENHPADSRVKICEDGIFQTLSSRMGTGGGNVPMVMEDNMEEQNQMVVRRLTPLECERLQGYPDGWTDIGDWVDSKGKTHKGESDSPRYKALGNSIALPFWEYLAEKMCAQYDRPTTMASLFDGIGGFPLVFSRHGCTPVWASEIEEFPIAVTKLRFPEKGAKQ
jgi:DNA (cytosine-5)-methyltransferase 1